jgi:hypothetical protein
MTIYQAEIESRSELESKTANLRRFMVSMLGNLNKATLSVDDSEGKQIMFLNILLRPCFRIVIIYLVLYLL